MTNKREFFFIVFLCAVSTVVFCATKRFSAPARALDAISRSTSARANTDAASSSQLNILSASVEDSSIPENSEEWSNVPSAENLTSGSSDAVIRTDAMDIDAGQIMPKIEDESKQNKETKETKNAQNTKDSNKEIKEKEIKETVPAKEYTQYSSTADPKSTVLIQLNNTNQTREKSKEKEVVKAQPEKGTIYEANKAKDNKTIESDDASASKLEKSESDIEMPQQKSVAAIGLKVADQKIKISQKKEETKWVEPIIKNAQENNSNPSSSSAPILPTAKSEEKNSAGGVPSKVLESKEMISEIPKIIAEPRKISIINKTDMANIQATAQTISAEPKKDSDGDGISDEIELKIGSDPNKKDSDGDGFADGLELSIGYNPIGTGVLAKSDLALIASPQLKNKEGQDVVIDSDGDGICDREELIIGTDPFNSDSDNDGFSDREEFSKGYNPLKAASANSGDDKIELENPEESEAPIAENLDVSSIVRQQNKNQAGVATSEQITLTGKAEPNSFIAIYVFSSPIADLIQADSDGIWLYVLDKTLDIGEHTVYSAVVDSAGSIVAKSNPVKFLIEEIEAAPLNIDDNISANIEASTSVWKSPQVYIALGIGAVILGVIGMMIVKELNS